MRTVGPRRALLVWAIGLVVWLALAAPDLERRVLASELGPWRDAELRALAPLVALRSLIPDPGSAWTAAAGGGARGAAPSPPSGPPSTSAPAPSPTPSLAPAPSPSPTPTPLRSPTADAPLRVLVVGDSIATDLGWALQNADAPLSVTVDTRPASGLARPDYFDWERRLASDLERERPELVVVMLGGNDAQSFLVDGEPAAFGTPAWRTTYAARVARLMRLPGRAGAVSLWVGLPIMRDELFSSGMRELNRIYAAQAEAAGVSYLDSWRLFADAQGRYAPYLPDPSGVLRPVRQADGIHLSMDGAVRLADRVIATLANRWTVGGRGVPSGR